MFGLNALLNFNLGRLRVNWYLVYKIVFQRKTVSEKKVRVGLSSVWSILAWV